MPNRSPLDPERFTLDCRGRRLDCRPGQPMGAHVMGILNVTPDSFSDGGRYLETDAALRRVEQMLEEGATLIDVGGASSRPRGKVYGDGALPISTEEEKARVLPVIEQVGTRFPEALISIDTYDPAVAQAALEAGAHLVNDITGLRYSAEIASVAAHFGVPLIVMHSLGRPGEMPHAHAYDNVVAEVKASLHDSLRRAEAVGVRHLVTDPGFGFGKTPEENLRLIGEVDALLTLGRPVMVGISRKSTIGTMLGTIGTMLGTSGSPVPIEARLFGTLGVTAAAVLRGATLVRTHDVRPTVEMLRLLTATLRYETA